MHEADLFPPPPIPEGDDKPLAGQCANCGRALTDPVSIAAGLGPVCRKIAKGERASKPHASKIELPAPADGFHVFPEFHYRLATGVGSFCHLVILRSSAEDCVIVASEHPGPPAHMSVTNSAEDIAAALVNAGWATPEGLVQFERYPRGMAPSDIDRVLFSGWRRLGAIRGRDQWAAGMTEWRNSSEAELAAAFGPYLPRLMEAFGGRL